jgi:RecB family endonuclease NucS
LSDYIAHYPHRLKDGFQPYGPGKAREKVLDDDSRADVLLRGNDHRPVIVECKQEPPTTQDVAQVGRYIKKLNRLTGEQATGVLVHGGARTVDEKVWRQAQESKIDIFQYSFDVQFAPSLPAR